MNCVSLYSGADNLGDGFIQAGHKIILCVEHDKDCCETIKLNHPDIEVINGKVSDHLTTLPKADCVIGGPPCPEFSRAKSDRTFDLCEVNNFKNAVEICKAKEWFMENVQDIFAVYKGKNFLVNCADYGVPQTRIRRIYTSLPLPYPTHSEWCTERLFGDPLKKWVSVRESLGLEGYLEDRKTVFGKYPSKDNNAKFRRYSTERTSPTIVTDSRLWYVSPTGFGNKNKKQISRSIDEPIMTIVNGNEYQFTDKPVMNTKYHQFKNEYNVIRKLTNEELAILQGFRKDFKFYGGKTSVRKQIGNALPAVVSKAFAEHILQKKEIII